MLAQLPVPSRLSVVAALIRSLFFRLSLQVSWDFSSIGFFFYLLQAYVSTHEGVLLGLFLLRTLCVDAEDPSHGKPALHASTAALG